MREIHGNCEYVFCPVGQGLFAPGRLAFSFEPLPQSGPSKEFYWAYDCGASTQSALFREVSRVRSALSMPYRRQLNTLGLFVLSHFDKDHISGIGRLLNGVTVEWLVLPYLYPTERLAIGVQSDEDDPDFLRFLIDPAAYVAGLPGVTVRNVAYYHAGRRITA